jgi:hypothetical protein
VAIVERNLLLGVMAAPALALAAGAGAVALYGVRQRYLSRWSTR